MTSSIRIHDICIIGLLVYIQLLHYGPKPHTINSAYSESSYWLRDHIHTAITYILQRLATDITVTVTCSSRAITYIIR